MRNLLFLLAGLGLALASFGCGSSSSDANANTPPIPPMSDPRASGG